MDLKIRLTTNSFKDEIIGWEETPQFGRYLKVRVTARPVDGKANLAAIKFLAKRLRIPRSQIKIVRGHISRLKTFQVPDSVKLPFD
jgi:uncharacterized protein (TIGR00251 family)